MSDCCFIGQGKFSYVFKAKRSSDEMCVALKLIKVFGDVRDGWFVDIRYGQ